MSEIEKTNTEKDSLVPESPEPVILFVNYQAAEVNNASWLVYREETGGKVVFAAYCLAFVITVFVALGYLGIFTKSPLPDGPYQTWIALILVLDVFFLPPLFAYWLWQLLKTSRLETFSRELRFSKPTLYSISNDGIQIQINSDTTISSWSHVTACYELADSLTFVIDGTIFPVPKRCFYSKEQLRQTRRLVIEKAVAYCTVGPQKTSIIYAGTPMTDSEQQGNEANKRDIDESKVDESETGGSDNSEISKPGLEHAVLLNGTEYALDEKHPNSSLILEPLIWHPASGTLTLECNYSLTQLKAADKLVFMKYDVPLIGLQYIAYLFIFLAYTQFVQYIMGQKQGEEINSILFKCTPLILLGAIAHARYHFEKRVERLRETVKLDLPILITLAETECTIRSRRTILSYPWGSFRNCIVTKEHYICRSKRSIVVIPKTAIDSRSKEIFVENLLRTKIKQFEEWS